MHQKTADFSMQNLKARGTRNNAFPVLIDPRCLARLLYPTILSVIIKEEINVFCDVNRLKESLSTKPALQRILEPIQRPEEKNDYTKEVMKRKQMKL